MSGYFHLQSTYEVILEFSTNTRPIRIEIFRSVDNEKNIGPEFGAILHIIYILLSRISPTKMAWKIK